MRELKARALSAALSGLAGAALALALLRPASAAFEDLGAGARAPGMGNAFTAVADDAYAVFYNPAGLSQLASPEFSASYSRLFMGLTDNSNLGLSNLVYATPLKGGAWGRFGFGWQRFSLVDLYSEQTLIFSYSGSPLLRRSEIGTLDWGVNLKYLSRSFTTPPEAYNAKSDGLAFTGLPDPVLSGANSMNTLDADAGLLLRATQRLSFGLMVTHLLEPSVGFADNTDVLSRGYKLGFGFKSLWTNLSSDLQFSRAPDGSLDKLAVVAAERYFPTLEHGQFGVRGSLGLGTRDLREVTAGLSYRINAIQLDYAFMLPLGTIQGTDGTHRVGLTYHFGAPRAEDEYAAELLARLRTAQPAAAAGYTYEFEALKRLAVSDRVLAAMIRADIEAGRYTQALKYLKDMVEIEDPELRSLRSRLTLVTASMPTLTDPKLKWELVASQGIGDYLDGRDSTAVKRLAYAYSIKPDDPGLEHLLLAVEAATGLKGERVTPRWLGKLSLVEEKLLRTQIALRENKPLEARLLGDAVLELEPANATALARVGTAQYLLGRPEEALAAWTQALQFEKSPGERAILARAIRQAESDVKKLKEQGGAKAEAVKAAPPVPPKALAEPADPREIERLYREGVELYVVGDKGQAAEIFRRILEIDPDNAQALKALKRLEVER